MDFTIQENYPQDITISSVIEDLTIRGYNMNNLKEDDLKLISIYIQEETDPVSALIMDCDCHPDGSCFLCR